MNKNFRTKKRGFTLVEILIAITIITIFAAGITVSLFGRVGDARQARAKQDISQIMTALNVYKLDNFRFPSAGSGLEALVNNVDGGKRWKGPYIERLPIDPWDTPYLYRNPGQNGKVDVYTLGADAVEGGEGEDADIGNWNLDE